MLQSNNRKNFSAWGSVRQRCLVAEISVGELSGHRHRRCSVKKTVLKNFGKFTAKHLCQNLFFNKVAGLSPVTLLKRDSGTGVFP